MKQRRQVDPQANRPLDPAKRQTLKKLASLGMLAVGADLSLSRLPALAAATPRPDPMTKKALREAAAGSNLVICVLDAARPDHFGCHGYPRPTTPNVDRLAKESFVFDNHFCQDTFTSPSTASLFTGQYPFTHLAYRYHPVEESAFTMALGFAEAGFTTAQFSSNAWTTPLTGNGFNFHETYDPDLTRELVGTERWLLPEPLLQLFGRWLEDHKRSRFFCYIHFTPPHRPYGRHDASLALFTGKQPPGYVPEKYHPGKWDFPLGRGLLTQVPPLPEWINLYDSNLRYGDWAAGEVERLLRSAGVYDRTTFILTSDHGEAFGEHGFVFHDGGPYDEVARIPLLVRFPRGSRARRIGALTQSIDILPTLCDLFQLDYPKDEVQGRSLLPLMTDARQTVHDHVFTHSHFDRDKYMIRSRDCSLFLLGKGNWRALYDLKNDPEQRRNVIGLHPEKAEELTDVFRTFAQGQRWDIMYILDPTARYRKRLEGSPRGQVSRWTQRQLRALGYL
jgi:arylsulfatase A-like enzyme